MFHVEHNCCALTLCGRNRDGGVEREQLEAGNRNLVMLVEFKLFEQTWQCWLPDENQNRAGLRNFTADARGRMRMPFGLSLRTTPTQERRRAPKRLRAVFFAANLAVLSSSVPAHGTSLSDAKGTTGSCVGIGPIVNKCVEMMENSGLIRTADVGNPGLTFGIAGKDDGVITQVVNGGAGSQAGLRAGDRILAINGKPTRPTPGMIAAERIFGVAGAAVVIKVRRGARELQFNLTRDSERPPRGPQSGTMLIAVRPMINWKGQFIPCMGAGPAGFAAIDVCHKTFAKDGYIKTDDLGATGIHLDLDRPDAAVVTQVNQGSAAARAGIQVGDEILQVNELPLGESVGGIMPELLFGRAGDSFSLTVESAKGTRTAKLVLGRKPKE